ncbi:hypothetical protein FRC06_011879, partial [Ceratobasidium sp. 370]
MLTPPVDSKAVSPDSDHGQETLTNDESMFQHKIIGNTIAHAFFRSTKGIGVKHLARFTPLIPAATIAYVCAIIRHLIKSYEFDNPKAANLKADKDADSYRMYMRMMQEVVQVNPGALTNIRSKITLQCLKFRPRPAALPVVQVNIGAEQEVDRETMLEIKAILGDDAPDIDEWAGMLRWKGKGK